MKKTFSERIGVSEPISIQIDSMDDALRNSIWNYIFELYKKQSDYEKYWRRVAEYYCRFFFKEPVDLLPSSDTDCGNWIRIRFYKVPWNRVYDFLEFLVDNHSKMGKRPAHSGFISHSVTREQIIDVMNFIFERELSGYRFISNVITPITDKSEKDEIEKASITAKDVGLIGAHEHIRTALQLLGKKPDPDYRNSIKESISAVESVATVLSGKKKSKGLEDALDELMKHTEIHPALKEGFVKLYGYTSDEDGIRHKIIEQPNVGFTEAKYMLVSCSAFVNYLIGKADEAGLLRKK